MNPTLIRFSPTPPKITGPLQNLLAKKPPYKELKTGSTIQFLKKLDEHSFLSTGSEKTITVWRQFGYTFQIQTVLNQPKPITTLLVLDSNTFISGSKDKTIRVWERQQYGAFQEKQCLESHMDEVRCLEQIDATTFISSGDDHTIRIWEKNLEHWEQKHCIVDHFCHTIISNKDTAFVSVNNNTLNLFKKEGCDWILKSRLTDDNIPPQFDSFISYNNLMIGSYSTANENNSNLLIWNNLYTSSNELIQPRTLLEHYTITHLHAFDSNLALFTSEKDIYLKSTNNAQKIEENITPSPVTQVISLENTLILGLTDGTIQIIHAPESGAKKGYGTFL